MAIGRWWWWGSAISGGPWPTPRVSPPGVPVCSLFDVEPSLVGSRIQGVTVQHLDDFETVAAADLPSIGVIATPASAAQDVADRMIAAGVASLLNFAPKVLTVPPTVLLRYVDLSIELQVMSFYSRTGTSRGRPRNGRRCLSWSGSLRREPA